MDKIDSQIRLKQQHKK